MDKEIKDGEISKESRFRVDIVKGDLVLEIIYDSTVVDASLKIRLDSGEFLDALDDAIPGNLDSAVFSLIKEAIK